MSFSANSVLENDGNRVVVYKTEEIIRLKDPSSFEWKRTENSWWPASISCFELTTTVESKFGTKV